jgi:isopenicillin N synthase-like dioxygenase
MSDFKYIPSIDLADFKSEDPKKKKAFIKEIGLAYEKIGFVAVKNHGLNENLCAQLYKEVEDFFQMEKEQKKQYEIIGLSGQRGYVSFGKEHAKNRNEGDLKEFWHFGQTVKDNDPIKESYPENIIVNELPNFNLVGLEVYQKLEDAGRDLLRAIALYLNLEEDYFDAKIHNGNSILRPIHYPPITNEPRNAVRAAEHEDINLITLLMGASADGLQVLNKSGEWISVRALPDQIVVNVGDMLQRLTNNKLKSTTHRVINPPREKWGTSRYSVPFFLHPRSEVSLKCLESCVIKEKPKEYSDITAGEYLNKRILELGLKK